MTGVKEPNLVPLVRLTGITKRFGGNVVLEDVSFELCAGEAHIVAGENGAGKSTLIKILGGIYSDFAGRIQISGRDVVPLSPKHAAELGISTIHQELSLVGSLSVAENIFLGQNKSRAGIICRGEQVRAAEQLLAEMGIEADPTQPVESLNIATQQCVEIAKALSKRARIIVMDEPTSALDEVEAARLFKLIEQLKANGCGIIYITHKMEEIHRIGDRITILRDGRSVATVQASDVSTADIVRMMIGREVAEQYVHETARLGSQRLEIQDFAVFPRGVATKPAAQNISMSVRSGEILGIGGLQGSGASELLLGLFGAYGDQVTGRMFIDGRKVQVGSPAAAINEGIALLTNDRKVTGLVGGLSVVANMVLAVLPRLATGGWRNPTSERSMATDLAQRLQLRAPSLDMPISALSGGNQQKVAIGKWLATEPRVLLLDDPTRGIDLHAKREFYHLLSQLTKTGIAIVLISSELPELLALSDRLIVMHRGRQTDEMLRKDASPGRVLAAAMGDAQLN